MNCATNRNYLIDKNGAIINISDRLMQTCGPLNKTFYGILLKEKDECYIQWDDGKRSCYADVVFYNHPEWTSTIEKCI